jgi:chitinase
LYVWAATLGLALAAAPAWAAGTTVTYQLSQDWGTGYGAGIVIRNNTATPVANWTLEFDFPNNINSIWDARVQSKVGNHYTIVNAGWNATIGGSATVSFGWNGAPGNVTGAPTNCKVNGQPADGCGAPVDTQPPSAPAGLTSPSQTTSSIALAWSASTDNVGVVAYDVFQNGGSSPVASPTGTSATIGSLAANTSFTFTVRARDAAGNSSAPSAALTVKTKPSTCAAVPSVPANLRSTAMTSATVDLAWNASTSGTGCSAAQYLVFQNGAQITQTSGTTVTASGLLPATTYSFSVAAINEAGASAQSAAVQVTTNPVSGGGKRVVAYFAQWGIYARNYFVKNIETSGSADKITHINYAFGNVINNRCSVGVIQLEDGSGNGGDYFADVQKSFDTTNSVDGVADTFNQTLKGNWNQLKKLKARHPGLKVLISLGGWTWSKNFTVAARPENRVAFVASCIDAYIKGNIPANVQGDPTGGPGAAAGIFDGIDIDWEYPAAPGRTNDFSPDDTANFTALLAEFRKQLDAVRPGLLLTIAAPAGQDKYSKMELGKIANSLDFINLMTYDFHGAWETTTNFHAPLFKPTGDPSTGVAANYFADFAVQDYLRAGVPASKLVLGLPFYGRGWTGVANVNNGLFQTGTPAPATFDAGVDDYKKLSVLPGFTKFRDNGSKALWIFNGSTFWTFDDPTSLGVKTTYIKTNGLGGAMIFSLDGDTASGELMTAVKNGLQ